MAAANSVLMIDNYDSFTYNLVQMIESLPAEDAGGEAVRVEVVRNDAESVDALLARGPLGIVLSPGPGRPESAGVCVELLKRRAKVPVFGVCLGHQALGLAFGGEVGRAPNLMHGKTSSVRHDGRSIFEGVDNPFEATRYHSLEVRRESLPEVLEPLAWTEADTLMAMRHRELPYWSVQFHPESVMTLAGPAVMANFLRFCRES